MQRLPIAMAALALPALGVCGGNEIGSTELEATWVFQTGDCTSNAIDAVQIVWTPPGGSQKTADFPCAVSRGKLGTIVKGAYAIVGRGLDESGVVRMESYGQTATFPDGRAIDPIEITLRPKASDITVSWNGCPSGVILPYFISVYPPPATPGGTLTNRIKQVQESCSSRKATLESIAPGDYVVELDSRAVTPKVLATKAVTVIAGENATVALSVP